MEIIPELLAALICWRVLLATGTSLLLALLLSSTFAGFTAGYCISLVLLGTVAGII